uniref:hypothetical protein n=1 Tax=Microcoleus sp. OTE_8_concoct_300 TaxID=2964710 RepID=UPI00403F8822
MFQRQQPQPQPEPPKFTPSDVFDRLQIYSNSFFLSACVAGGILAVNIARVSPNYFWLIVAVTIAAIVTLAFFPNVSNQQVRRIGILAVAVGVLLGNWEFFSTFKMKQIHIAIAVGATIMMLIAIGII